MIPARALGLGLALACLASCQREPARELPGEAVTLTDDRFLEVQLALGTIDVRPFSPIGVDIQRDTIFVREGQILHGISRGSDAHVQHVFGRDGTLLPTPGRDGTLVWLEVDRLVHGVVEVFAASADALDRPWPLLEYARDDARHAAVVVGDRVVVLTEHELVHVPVAGGDPQILALRYPVRPYSAQIVTDQGGRITWLADEPGRELVMSSDAGFEAERIELEDNDLAYEVRAAVFAGDSLIVARISESRLILERHRAGAATRLFERAAAPEVPFQLLSDGTRAILSLGDHAWQFGPDSHAPLQGLPTEPGALLLDEGVLVWRSVDGDWRRYHDDASPIPSPLRLPSPPGNADDDIWGSLDVEEIAQAYGNGGLGLVERAPAPPRGRVRMRKGEVDGPLDHDIVRRIVRAHQNELRDCYIERLLPEPDLAVELELEFEFVIDAQGEVRKVRDRSDASLDRKLRRCVTKAIQTWKFPKPRGGGEVTARYPFVFEPMQER